MTPKEKRNNKKDKTLDNKYTITFTKAELTFIFNVLLAREYKLGDASIGWPVVKKIEPFVVVDTNIKEDTVSLTEDKN